MYEAASREEALQCLRLADRDVVAFETLRDSPRVSLASTCFHAQQAVKKCMKAVLFQHRIEFRRTHDLTMLAGLLKRNEITPPVTDGRLQALNPCAVDFRYDEEKIVSLPDRETLKELVSEMRHWAGELVG